ncbi:MAG: polysaccharide deacetylase family protein [Symploca sp. SIO2G7]|nr:polysaccharide deacetylase family protein [Symploca sp. SIO2G7]
MKKIGRKVRKLHRKLHQTSEWWLQKRFTSRALILMYHGVAETEGVDPWLLFVTPKRFAEQLEIVSKHFHPMSLKQLAQAHQDGNIPERAVAITFDDGYANNLYQAKPLLERFNIPATVFVTTGHLRKKQEFWSDELEQVLLRTVELPEKLCLNINGSNHQWELGAAINYSEADYRHDCDRQIDGRPQFSARLSFLYSVGDQLQPLAEEEQQNLLREIRTWANFQPNLRPTHSFLTLEEVGDLAEGELIEVGAHTVNHPLLSAHPPQLQQNEIQRGKTELEEILGYPVTSFAYPFGGYTQETIPLVQEAGFTCACSTVEETVWHKSDAFQLPRFCVRNFSGTEFEQRLLRWFHS